MNYPTNELKDFSDAPANYVARSSREESLAAVFFILALLAIGALYFGAKAFYG